MHTHQKFVYIMRKNLAPDKSVSKTSRLLRVNPKMPSGGLQPKLSFGIKLAGKLIVSRELDKRKHDINKILI